MTKAAIKAGRTDEKVEPPPVPADPAAAAARAKAKAKAKSKAEAKGGEVTKSGKLKKQILCRHIKKGEACPMGKKCPYSHNKKVFDGNGNFVGRKGKGRTGAGRSR